jgi:hypothetical protein
LNQFDVYSGYKGSDIGGIPSGSEDLTGPFRTDKKYFRVAPNSSILCGTAYMDRDHDVVPDDKVQFFCVPRIDSGDTKLYMEKDMRGMVNSQFGVDEIIDSNLTVNIVADDNRSIRYGGGVHPDKFREYIPPKKTFFQKLFD